MNTREAVMDALFACLQRAPGFLTYSRKFRFATDVKGDDQPALVILQRDENTAQKARGLPGVRTFPVFVVLYARVDKDAPGDSVLNPLLDAVEAALAPDDKVTGDLTLGGLVTRVVIEGDTIRDNGDIDPKGQAVAVIPVKILGP